MKIKNVIFSGFAAAIFAGVCGAVDAASVSLVSKTTYEEGMATKQNVLTPGDNINIANDIISATGLVTESKLTEVQTALQTAIDGKQAAGEYAAADALEELAADVEALKSSSTSNEVIEQLNAKVDAIAADYVTDSEMQTAIAGVQALIPSLVGYAKTADLAAVATSGQYADLEGKPEIPSIEGLATSEELNTLKTTLEASIAEKQEKGEYLTAASLKDLEDAVEALQTGKADASTVETIQETISKLGDTYASKADMTAADSALQAAIEAVDAKIPSLEGYAKTADLATVATSGQYADLEGKPEIPSIEGLATSEALNTLKTTLEASIAEKQEKGEYLVAADLKTLEDAVEALQTGKADASTVTTIQETISNLGETYATKADMTAADEALQAAIDNMDLSAYAKVADVYSKTDADAKFLIMRDANALGANLQWNEAGKLDTKGIATADGLKELEDKVADAVTNTELEAKGYQTQTDVENLISGKADSATVASDIATALQTAKDYADANDADTIYDDTQVKADIAANTQAIANIKEYDDTALAARVSTNETGVADNKSAIEALQTKTTDLGALAYKNTVASADIDEKAVTTAKIAGEAAAEGEIMMMTAGADGVATWTSVKVY